MDAVGAEHVPDLVRVGDDGRRAERQHEACELVDEQLHALEVHVRVDEARNDVRAVGVERLRALVLAEAGDHPVAHRDVDLEPLAREDGEHASAANDEVGRLVAACNGEPARQITRLRYRFSLLTTILCSMTVQLVIAYAALWATLLNALLVRARVSPVRCANCGQPFERRELGGRVCTCDRFKDAHRQARQRLAPVGADEPRVLHVEAGLPVRGDRVGMHREHHPAAQHGLEALADPRVLDHRHPDRVAGHVAEVIAALGEPLRDRAVDVVRRGAVAHRGARGLVVLGVGLDHRLDIGRRLPDRA